MSADGEWPVHFSGGKDDVMAWLRSHNVERIRAEYTDFNGIARGKAVSLAQFEHVMQHGLAFAATIFALDIVANVVPGTDYAESIGYGDFILRPDLSTLRLLRHEGGTAQVVGTLMWPDGSRVDSCPRNILARVAERAADMGYTAFAAPEFEFYLLNEDYELLDEGVQCYSMQKRTKFLSEELALLEAASAHAQLENSHYEYGPGQYEMTMRYQEIRSIADAGSLFRATLKEAAMGIGRRISFMAKPFDGATGNSCHIHLSLVDAAGNNVFAAPNEPQHISDTCRHFIGGVLAHMPELTAIFFPNSNSYRRLVPANFAPISLVWGVDNRTAAVRVLNETPEATRSELRVCGGDIHVHLAMAAYLAAGLDGIQKGTDPGEQSVGDLDEQDVERLPDDWGDALDAFDASDWVKQAFGDEFHRNYSTVKRYEYAAFRRTVPESERKTYIEFL
jgi:glutamine synthetase